MTRLCLLSVSYKGKQGITSSMNFLFVIQSTPISETRKDGFLMCTFSTWEHTSRMNHSAGGAGGDKLSPSRRSGSLSHAVTSWEWLQQQTMLEATEKSYDRITSRQKRQAWPRPVFYSSLTQNQCYKATDSRMIRWNDGEQTPVDIWKIILQVRHLVPHLKREWLSSNVTRSSCRLMQQRGRGTALRDRGTSDPVPRDFASLRNVFLTEY